jgi:predicted nuclease of predicted toxin-antitoxin system
MCLKLLIDMNLSPTFVAYLRDCGIEAQHWIDVGNPEASDLEIMEYASANGYTVVTMDLDFGDILVATQDMAPSVVQIRAKEAISEKVFALSLEAIQTVEQELLKGAILTIDLERARLRMLPIHGQ